MKSLILLFIITSSILYLYADDFIVISGIVYYKHSGNPAVNWKIIAYGTRTTCDTTDAKGHYRLIVYGEVKKWIEITLEDPQGKFWYADPYHGFFWYYGAEGDGWNWYANDKNEYSIKEHTWGGIKRMYKQ